MNRSYIAAGLSLPDWESCNLRRGIQFHKCKKVAIYGVKEIALALDCLFLLSNTFCTNIWYQNISWTFYYINHHFTFLWYCCKHHTSLVKWSSAVCVHEKMATLDLHVNWTNLSVLEKFFLILNFYFHTSSYLCLI